MEEGREREGDVLSWLRPLTRATLNLNLSFPPGKSERVARTRRTSRTPLAKLQDRFLLPALDAPLPNPQTGLLTGPPV